MMDTTAARIVHNQEGGPGRAGGKKIENHHMGDCPNVDMFPRIQYHPETDSAC